jgi:phage repressor protein C with HTH and peptisase S24 domain
MELNVSEIIERLNVACGAKNTAEMARKLGINSSYTSGWKKRDFVPYKEVYEISRKYGYSMDWILTGEGDPKEQAIQLPAKATDYIHIPQFSIEASAGHGALVEAESIDQHLAFSAEWLAKQGIGIKDLIALYARGDSMEPTIISGDSLVIDKSIDAISSDGGIYVISYDGELYVKRVQKMLDGKVSVTSDNANYSNISIDKSELVNLKVIGRVVWYGRPLI